MKPQTKPKRKEHKKVSKHFIATGDMKPQRGYRPLTKTDEKGDPRLWKRELVDNTGKFDEKEEELTIEEKREREFQVLQARIEKSSGYTSHLNSFEKEWENVDESESNFALDLHGFADSIKFLSIQERLRLPDEYWVDDTLRVGLKQETPIESKREEKKIEIFIPPPTKNEFVDVTQDLSILNKILNTSTPTNVQVAPKEPSPSSEIKCDQTKDLDEWLNGLL